MPTPEKSATLSSEQAIKFSRDLEALWECAAPPVSRQEAQAKIGPCVIAIFPEAGLMLYPDQALPELKPVREV